MVEKLNIVQSTTEPDKNNIWLKDGELKKFGAKGWSTIGGGGVSLDGPQVSEPSGGELVPINDNGENKVITINNLLNKGKDVCKVIIDYGTERIVNYSEVVDALVNSNNSNKCFVATYSDTKSASVAIILYIVYDGGKKTISLMMPYDDGLKPAVAKYEFSSENGLMNKVSISFLPEWQ